jgi:hypothetical protein
MSLARKLVGHVPRLALSRPGSEVLQTVVAVVPPEASGFIATELAGFVVILAERWESSQVLCRMLQHWPSDQTAPLVEELLDSVPELVCNVHGSAVIQYVLEYGSPSQIKRVCEMVFSNIKVLSLHAEAADVISMASGHACLSGYACLSEHVRAKHKLDTANELVTRSESVDSFLSLPCVNEVNKRYNDGNCVRTCLVGDENQKPTNGSAAALAKPKTQQQWQDIYSWLEEA